MKFSIKVISLFILFIFIAYALPLYVDNGERTAPPSSIARNEQASIDEDKGYPLPVMGYESYIGQSIAATPPSMGSRLASVKPTEAVNGGYSGQMLRTTSK